MDLFLMRHTDAVGGTGIDSARALSEKGRKQATRMGEWLQRMRIRPFRVLTSPYLRARETADIVAVCMGAAPPQNEARLAAGMDPETGKALVYEFGEAEGSLMLVGHAPDLGWLATHLIEARAGTIRLGKGSIVQLETLRPGFGQSVLMRFVDLDALKMQ